jgi:hypothetical protein
MSYAIFELELEEPPVFTQRTHEGAWFVTCARCGAHSSPAALLSQCMEQQAFHADPQIAVVSSTDRPQKYQQPFACNGSGPHPHPMRVAI